MRRLLVGVLVVVALLLAAAIAFRGPISLRLMRSVAEARLAANPLTSLEDGIHVILCGAGGPLPDPERSGPCVAVIAGDTFLVVDAGGSAGRNVAWLQLPAGEIDATLLTHFHSDHIDGLGELALQRWVNAANTESMPVIGPEGVEEVVAGFNRAYQADFGYRTAHHGEDVAPTSGAGTVARPFSVPEPGEFVTVWDQDGMRVTAFRVEHDPVDPAVGYRFDYKGRSVVVSGDTKRSDAVLKAAKGVDLLVHEALSARLVMLMNEAATAAKRPGIAKITHDILDYHTTPVEAAEVAEEAGAGHLLYYHIVPPLLAPGLDVVFLEGVSDAYSGGVTLGVDGSTVSLPAGSSEIVTGSR